MQVFRECHAGRQYSANGPNPISASDIAACLDLLGIDDATYRRRQFRMIRALDRVWLDNGKGGGGG